MLKFSEKKFSGGGVSSQCNWPRFSTKNRFFSFFGGVYVYFFISAPIFKFKVSMERSHQCSLNGVVLMKINGAVREILMKTCFVRNGFSLISQERLHRFSKK